ncbi:MAG: hypothetical protein OXH96_21030 [Spirochaetaceae bacterium]|nr:hypothetical protein [Spirochaetaceae bacterium]
MMSNSPEPRERDVFDRGDKVERWLADYHERVPERPRDRTDEPEYVKPFWEGVARLEAMIRDLIETKPTGPSDDAAGEE